MFVGRNFWKSLLLEFEKSEISLSSFNGVISLMHSMAQSCAFPCRCFLAFWISWKWSSRLAFDCFLFQDKQVPQQVPLQVTQNMPQELLTRAIYNTSNLHLLLYSIDDNGSSVVKIIVVVSVLSCLSLPIMIYPTLPRFSYEYIGTLTKSFFFPIHFIPQWFMYVYS